MSGQQPLRPPPLTSNSSSKSITTAAGKAKKPAAGSSTTPADQPYNPRAGAACSACRARKSKCLPPPGVDISKSTETTCQACLSSGTECVYRPTRDRAAFSRQYVQSLESRVQALEAFQARALPIVVRAESQGDEPIITVPASVPTPAAPTTTAAVATPVPNARFAMDANPNAIPKATADDELIEDIGHMARDPNGTMRWIGSSSTLTLMSSFAAGKSREGSEDGSDGEEGEENTASNSTSRERGAPANPYYAPVAGAGIVKALPTVADVEFPEDPEYAARLIDAYFGEIHPSLPVLHENTFRRQFAELMERRETNADEEKNAAFISVVFSVFALGERVIMAGKAWHRERLKALKKAEKELRQKQGSPVDKLHEDDVDVEDEESIKPGEAEAGVLWFERAQVLQYIAADDVDLCIVQQMTLKAAFQASVNALPKAWLSIGQAIRVAMDLGLHRSTLRMKLPFLEKQMRARIWWAVYGVDRIVSISLGRPLSIEDLDCDIQLPLDMDDDDVETADKQAAEYASRRSSIEPSPARFEPKSSKPGGTWMSGFIALCKLYVWAGRVHRNMYRPHLTASLSDPVKAVGMQNSMNKLDMHLRKWLDEDVPVVFKSPSSIPVIQVMSAVLSNSYFTILIALHRAFLPNPNLPPMAPPSDSPSLAHCMEAARSVIHIAKTTQVLVPPSHHLAIYCQMVWSAATILLLCEVLCRDQVVVDAVGTQVQSVQGSLRALEPVWPGARQLKELLGEIDEKAKQKLAQMRADAAAGIHPPKRRQTTYSTKDKNPGFHPMGAPDKPQRYIPPSRIENPPSPPLEDRIMFARKRYATFTEGGDYASPGATGHKRLREDYGRSGYATSDTRSTAPNGGSASSSPNQPMQSGSLPRLSQNSPGVPLVGAAGSSMLYEPSPTSLAPGSFDGSYPFDLVSGLSSVSGADVLQNFTNAGLSFGLSGLPATADTPSAEAAAVHDDGSMAFTFGHLGPLSGAYGGSLMAATDAMNLQGYVDGLDGADFWSNIASTDWDASPSVPFGA